MNVIYSEDEPVIMTNWDTGWSLSFKTVFHELPTSRIGLFPYRVSNFTSRRLFCHLQHHATTWDKSHSC